MLRIIYLIVAIMVSATAAFAQQHAIVTVTKANLVGTPDATGKSVALVKRNDRVEVISERGGWSLVQAKDFVGWIRSSSVSPERFGNPSLQPDSGSGQGNGIGTGRGTGSGSGSGVGNGSGSGWSDGDGVPKIDMDISLPKSPTSGLRIISKPKPGYTDKARIEMVQGTVVLRVTFLASGKIGNVSVVKGLKFGLSAQAVDAAKRIRFEPERKNGKAKTVTKSIEYSFTIY